MVLPMWTMFSPWSKQSHGCSCQGCKATNHIGTLRNLPNPNTHQNSPEPSGTCLWNLHQHTPEPSGTFRNLSPEPTPAYARTLRNLPEPASGTYTAHTGTLRNLPEPSSGTCSCDPHRHTPELIWAEDPISLRCWGKKMLWKPWVSEPPCSAQNLEIEALLPRTHCLGVVSTDCWGHQVGGCLPWNKTYQDVPGNYRSIIGNLYNMSSSS